MRNKKLIFILMLTMIMLCLPLSGCDDTPSNPSSPTPSERNDPITKTQFSEIKIEPRLPFKDDCDYIPLVTTRLNETTGFKNLYIRPNNVEILDIEAFGHPLERISIGEDEYFCLDTAKEQAEKYDEFWLLVKFEKDTFFLNKIFNDYINDTIHLFSFDIYINYDETPTAEKQIMQFWFAKNTGYSNDSKIKILTDLDSIIQTTPYDGLYLPFADKADAAPDRQIIYYTGESGKEQTSANMLCFTLFDYKITAIAMFSDLPPNNGEQDAALLKGAESYNYNGIDFLIIPDTSAKDSLYIVHFTVENNTAQRINTLGYIRYIYQIERKNIDEVKVFIESLTKC